MNTYCMCKQPEVEEVDEGVFVCLKCKLEMEPRCEDAPEPDYDETTQEEDDFYSEAGNEWAINNSI